MSQQYEKTPESVDPLAQSAGAQTTPRQGVRNLAGIFVIGLFLFGCLFACGLIAFANLRGAPASAAENPVTRVVMATPDVPSAVGRDEESENVPLAPEGAPATSIPSASVELVEGEGELAFETAGTPVPSFSYNVGGKTYALGVTAVLVTENGTYEVVGDQSAVQAILDENDDGTGYGAWTRIWQGANEELFAWTYFFRAQCDQPFEGYLQWHRATQLRIEGGETGITCSIQIRRDLVSSREINPDPYTAANLKNSPLGLAWFTDGDGTTSCDGKTYELGLTPADDIATVQMPFPHEWAGVLTFEISVEAGHTQYLTQGERLSDEDTCTAHLED